MIDCSRILGDKRPSEEQERLCNFAARGVGNAVVQARAGCGKSKTITLMCASVNPRKKILIIAHNRHIADSMKATIAEVGINAKVFTYHGLGYTILNSKFRTKLTPDPEKYTKYVNANISELSGGVYDALKPSKKYRYKKNIMQMLEYSRYNKAQSVDEISELSPKYGVDIVDNEPYVVQNILKWGKEHLETIDFGDMIWLPYELGIKTSFDKNLLFDLIFVDEAQDSSEVQQNLINICKNRSTRLFIFGDTNQTINGWCGADTDAFKKFMKMDNVTEFKLNTSYRCSKAVGDKVRELIPDFRTPEFAKQGNVLIGVRSDDIKVGDMVLCRITSPLIDLHMSLLERGIPSRISGHDIGNELINHINSYEGIDDVQELISCMYGELFDRWEKLAESYECSLKSVVNDSLIVTEYDKILTVESVSRGLSGKDELIDRLKGIFADVRSDGNDKDRVDPSKIVTLSTVHRAKGLEADNVFILCPSLMPSGLAETDLDKEAEDNIIYVAWSRAKENLYFMSEKEYPPKKSYLSPNDIYSELISKKDEARGGHIDEDIPT